MCLVSFVLSCSMSKEEKLELIGEIRSEISSVKMESKSFGSDQQAVASFVERREKAFAQIKEVMHRTVGQDRKIESFDRFYLTGLLEEIRARDDISFDSAKRMTVKRLEKLKRRIEQMQ